MRKVIMLPAMVLIAQVALAQFNVGGLIGLNLSGFNAKEAIVNENSKIGYHIGGFVRYGEIMFIQPEILFKKTLTLVETYDDQSTVVDDDLSINYITVPIMLGVKVFRSEDGSSSFRLMAGPAFSYIMSIKDNDLTIDRDDFAGSAIAIDAGAGFDLWFLMIDLRYRWGLNDIFKGDGSMKNKSLMLTAGIKI